jgi:GntR family transcriptional regulator
LPSEAELARRFGCSRNVLREALDALRQEGLISRVPGVGTFSVVEKQLYGHDLLRSLAEQLDDGAQRIITSPLEARLMPAPLSVSLMLGLKPDEEVVFFERRLYLDGTPLSVWASYLPASIAGDLLDCELSEDFYKLLEEDLRLHLGVAEICIDALCADEALASLLESEVGGPILHLTRLMRQSDGEPLELGFVHLRGERIQFVHVLQRYLEHHQS